MKQRPKPFAPRGARRILYVSDPSSIAYLLFPDPAEPGDLRRWVDMLADSGVDTFNQEVYNQGWTVYWRSEKLPYDQRPQHQRFLPMLNAGVQPLAVLLDQCHKRGMTCVAGFRMNDTHNFPVYAEFIESHPELRLSKSTSEGEYYKDGKPLDFTFAEVRKFVFEAMRELATRFDVDGLELCFRDPGYFPFPHGRRRSRRMTDLVREIRAMLDEQGRRKRKTLLLGARVPSTLAECLYLGLDVPAWIGEGLLDYLSPQDGMFADFNAPYAEFAALTRASRCRLYPALLPWTSRRARARLEETPLTPANCRALAHTFYSVGADGLSIYNHFVGAFWHPPFYPQALQMFHELRDPRRVARGGRHYVFDPVRGGIAARGADGSAAASGAQRIVLGRGARRAAGEYRFRLYEDAARVRGVTLLFRGFGLTERDELAVSLNGVPIAPPMIGRTRRSDTTPGEWARRLPRPDGAFVECVPERGRVNFAADPGSFSTRWFCLPPAALAWGENRLRVALVTGDPDGAGQIVIDEVEVWVQPK